MQPSKHSYTGEPIAAANSEGSRWPSTSISACWYSGVGQQQRNSIGAHGSLRLAKHFDIGGSQILKENRRGYQHLAEMIGHTVFHDTICREQRLALHSTLESAIS